MASRCGRRDHMIAKTVAAHHLHRDQAVLDGRHLAGKRHRVVGVPRHPEPQRDRLHQRRRPRPVGDEALDQAGVGEDVDEDVLDPFACALSRSWCTSWKSRVASAVETMNVGSPYSDKSGSLAPTSMTGALMPAPRRTASTPARHHWPGSRYSCANGHSDLHRRGVDVA